MLLRMRARLRFLPSGRCLSVPAGTTLDAAVRQAGLPMASACGADGICGRCGVQVLRGEDRLPGETPAERDAKQRNRVAPELRLACRVALPPGEFEITALYW
jgi:ferredoxin